MYMMVHTNRQPLEAAACRVHRADQKLLLYHGIVQALLAGWALLLSVTAGTQPVVACKCNTTCGASCCNMLPGYYAVTVLRTSHDLSCTAAAVAGGVANVWKLNQIFPAPTSSTASEEEKKRGARFSL